MGGALLGLASSLAAQYAAGRGTGRHCRLAGQSWRVSRSPGTLRDDGADPVLVLSPWAIRNALIFGEPVWTTTHGGYTLALANNEVYYRDVLNGPPGGVWMGHDQWLWWDSVNRDTTGMSEPQADRFLRNRVVELAIAQPLTFLRAGLQRLGRFWSLAPAGAVYSPHRALGDGCLDPAALDRPGAGARPPIALALAPDRRTSPGCGPQPGSHPVLDRPANASTHRAGDRACCRVGSLAALALAGAETGTGQPRRQETAADS